MAVKEEEAQVIKVNKLILDLGAILEAGKYLNIWKLNNNFQITHGSKRNPKGNQKVICTAYQMNCMKMKT